MRMIVRACWVAPSDNVLVRQYSGSKIQYNAPPAPQALQLCVLFHKRLAC